MLGPAQPPEHLSREITPTSAPSIPAAAIRQSSSPSKLPINFSPPLIVMVVIAAAAFLLVTYSRSISRHLFRPSIRLLRRYCHRRHPPHLPSLSDIESPPYESSDGFYAYSPYGLDDSVIKSMPLSIYTTKKKSRSRGDRRRLMVEAHDCAVCLLEFEENDYIRTLPQCCHSFHVDCIDMWLRTHANCPLCRASIFLPPESPLTPVMASRIRPSFDDGSLFLESMFLEPLMEAAYTPTTERRRRRISADMASPEEIVSVAGVEDSERMMTQSVDRRASLLKRSYSLGFERNIASERIVLEPVTVSPWRYNQRRGGGGSLWRRTTSPWSSITKSRAFSFRSNRGMKSPFFRRGRGFSFIPLSESGSSSIRFGGVGSSRRSKSIASPMFGGGTTMRYSSSRMRCGDPEALLSPERYGGRR